MINDGLAGTLLAFDVDGTLVRSDGTVAAETIDALGAASEAGARLTLATGRDWAAVVDILQDLPSVSYALCINGIEVLTRTGELLHAEELAVDVAAKAIEALRAAIPGIAVGLGINSTLVGEPGVADLLPPGVGDVTVVDNVLDSLGPGLRDVVLTHPDRRDDLEALYADCRRALPVEGLDLAYSGLPMLEIVPPGAGKDSGLAWLANHLEVPTERVVAFGDGLNDLTMLRWAGTGVAMGQAAEAVLDAADEATEPVDEGGVAAWIHAHL